MNLAELFVVRTESSWNVRQQREVIQGVAETDLALSDGASELHSAFDNISQYSSTPGFVLSWCLFVVIISIQVCYLFPF